VFTGLLSDAGEADLLHRFINASDLAEQVTSMRLVIVISLDICISCPPLFA